MEPNRTCERHLDAVIRYYCGDCERALCKECVSDEHASHVVTTLAAVLSKYQLVIRTTQQRVHSSVVATAPVSELRSVIADVLSTVDPLLNACFDALPAVLCEAAMEQRKLFLANLKRTDVSIEAITRRLVSLGDAANGQPTIDVDSLPELNLIRERVALTKENSDNTANDLQGQIELQNELNDTIDRLCKLVDRIDYPLEVLAAGDGLKRCVVNRHATLYLTESRGSPLRGDSVEAIFELLSGERTEYQVEIKQQTTDRLSIQYCLACAGTYKFFIKYRSLQIRGSPFLVKCYEHSKHSVAFATGCAVHPDKKFHIDSTPVEHGPKTMGDLLLKIGEKGKLPHQFTNPQSVCVSNQGHFIVTDSQHQSVKVFDCGGEFMFHFGGRGREMGKMQRPTGVAFDRRHEHILVADYDNNWISIFTKDGRFIRRFGANRLLGPKGITIGAHGEVIVADNKASTIYTFDGGAGGKLIRHFGSRGEKPHQLAGPHYVAVRDNGELFVSDFHHHCVKVYASSSGEYLGALGENGTAVGQFNAPTGVAVCADSGCVLVGDWGNSRVQAFSADHRVVATVGPVYGPQGLALTAEGRVAVCDSGNQCVKLYQDVLAGAPL